ncbi:MAG: exo-alpha-sialidase [Deferribacteres bacterium]|nr:exo-alpha-sialidase [Deferribacteres bacterium]
MHESVLKSEFVFELENAPTPECHASTVAESKEGLVAAWFAGTKEKNKDVGIWVSRLEGTNWTAPVEVVNGVQDDGTRYPCWNPVLFQPEDHSLMLFYKVGPSPREWWGMLVTSDDGGKTWSAPEKLPEGILGPIKNKPVQLANGDLLCPTSTEHDGWRVQIERTADFGKTWTTTGDLNDGKEIGAIQPSILFHADSQLQILCRTKNEFISESWSNDNGETWSPMTMTDLPNPNSGIDAVTLKDGRQLLIYNPTNGDWGARVPLSVAISPDGKKWTRVFDLEPVTNPDTVDDEEYSYPGVIQTADGLVHIVYTWNRKSVRHVVLDPAKLEGVE